MWNEAKTSLKSLLARFPSSPLALEAKRLLLELQAYH
jgi:hypothetical protein